MGGRRAPAIVVSRGCDEHYRALLLYELQKPQGRTPLLQLGFVPPKVKAMSGKACISEGFAHCRHSQCLSFGRGAKDCFLIIGCRAHLYQCREFGVRSSRRQHSFVRPRKPVAMRRILWYKLRRHDAHRGPRHLSHRPHTNYRAP